MVPCIAAGGMKEYAEFIKEGNFSPMSVLNPELGMDSAIFAKDRASNMSGRVTGLSGRMTGMSGDDDIPLEKENINLDQAHAKVTELLNKIEEKTKTTNEAFKIVGLDKVVEKRYKGRRRKISVGEDISQLSALDTGRGTDSVLINSANSSRSSGYQSQPDVRENSSIGRIGEVEDDFGDEGKIKSKKTCFLI